MEKLRPWIPAISLVIGLVGLYFTWKQYQDQKKYMNCSCHEENNGGGSLSPIQ